MEKLIVHIGYPKTATSSLQKNVFLSLHERNRLHYLGEETSPAMGHVHHDSKFVKNIILGLAGEMKFPYCIPSNDLDRYRVDQIDPAKKLAKHKGFLRPFLQDGMINILSYETLLMPCRAVTTWLSFPQRLHDALPSDKTNVQIVVTLRNQAALMESFFFEKSLSYYLRSAFATPRQLYFEDRSELSLRDCEQVNIFNFLATLTAYQNVFGRNNIHILFYEDIANNPDDYFNAWARILDIPASELSDMFTSKPKFRVTAAENNHFKLRVSVFDYLLRSNHISSLSLPVASNKKSWVSLMHRIIGTLKRFPFASRWRADVKIAKFTRAEKTAIHHHFKASNAKVAQIYDLDVAKMKNYGYL